MPWPPMGFHVMVKPHGPICNLACEYCYYLPKQKLYPDSKCVMTDDVLEEFTRQYINAQKTKMVTFAWQGGEPLLMGLDFFKKAVELQEKYKKPGMQIQNTLQTNGTLIDDDWAKFFHAHEFLIGISIDGPPELHNTYRKDKTGNGSFQRVKKGLVKLQKNGVDYNILACVSQANVHHPLDVYRYFRDDLDAQFVQFIPIVQRDNETGHQEGLRLTDRSISGEEYGNFLISVFDEWVRNDVGTVFVQIFDVTLNSWMRQPASLCIFSAACGNAMALEHNGDLYSCDHFVEPRNKLGNIMDTHLLDLVGKRKQYQFAIKKSKKVPQYCKECEFWFICHGACPKNRVDKDPSGEPNLNHLCAGYYKFFTHIAPYMEYMINELRHGRPAVGIMEYLKKQ